MVYICFNIKGDSNLMTDSNRLNDPDLIRLLQSGKMIHFWAMCLLFFFQISLSSCSAVRQMAEDNNNKIEPEFNVEGAYFVSFDGTKLGLTVWPAQVEGQPEIVVVGLHGMNDWAEAFYLASPWWAQQGVTTYAYDQRSFGRSPNRGIWPDEELLRQDLRTAVAVARKIHPNSKIVVVGISMGAAVSMTAFASEIPPDADILILSGPGLRGWGSLPILYRFSLAISKTVRPGWIVRPPKYVKPRPSDNKEMLYETSKSENKLNFNRIDHVAGLVTLMENAHRAAKQLPAEVPTLLTYGANDFVIPKRGVKRTAKILPRHVRTIYYKDGFHMLLRDLQSEIVWNDVLSFMRDPSADFPSGEPTLPWHKISD